MFLRIFKLVIIVYLSLQFEVQSQLVISHQHITLSIFALDGLCIGKPVSVPFSSETIVPGCQVGNARSVDAARVEVARAVDAVVGLNKHGAHPAYEFQLLKTQNFLCI